MYHIDRWISAALRAAAFLAGAILLFTPGAVHAADTDEAIVEYPVPGSPRHVAVEAPGRIWFTLPAENQIGRLVVTAPDAFEVTTFTVATANSEPYDLVYADGFVWFTQKTGNKLGRFAVAGETFTEYALPTANSEPTALALAPNGGLWLVETAGNQLVRFQRSPALFTEFPYPIADAGLSDVTVENNNSIWVTAPDANRVANYLVSTANWVNIPTDYTGPVSVAVDAAGDPWVAVAQANQVGRYVAGTTVFWGWYALPSEAARPDQIVFVSTADSCADPQGRWYLWYSDSEAGEVGQFSLKPCSGSAARRALPLPGGDSRPWGLAADADGHVWIAEQGRNAIAEWRPPYFDVAFLPIVRK